MRTLKNVPVTITEFLLEKQCLSMATFSEWVDSKKELKSAVVDQTPEKDNPAAVASLKLAWLDAVAEVEAKRKRKSDGLDDDSLDTPLPDELHKRVEDFFYKTYSWTRLKGGPYCV